MPHAFINDLEIHYRDTGGDGFPVVLAHGYTGNSRNWALTVPVLRERYRVLSVDHRGHGLSARPDEHEAYALDNLAEDLYGVIRAAGIEQCFLVGHSMGGMVSQLMTLAHPEVVRALVLVDTAAEVPPGLRAKERYDERLKAIRIVEEYGMEALFDAQLKTADPRILANPQFIATWREQFLLTSPNAYIGGAKAMASRDSVLNRLGEINVPALVVCGANDEPFLEASHMMHKALPGSEIEIIPGAGHNPMIETPPEFNRILTGFLAKVSERTGATA